ncbi:transposase [Psychromonas sp. L1A2]|uniref:transposase n=1 Tax=Psychromonas sp. L1A2 TaxID=2686356 RepID=UPI00135B1E28|nr:transposase [Psychromonas sp. L1A2]
MTQSRQSQVSLSDTPYYHCISRCVRRAYLCGEDKYTEKSFEHRRQWVVERMHYLASLFNIDICAYAIMSNHYHLVLHIDEALNESLSHEEVCERWCQLYSKPILVERWQSEQIVSEAENKAALAIIEGWRGRLVDISWFMRCLNEFIARKANKEDECSGRFWEGRFKSQALLDEDALLTCMAYVDLNPVRAKMTVSVETSEYTSAYERLLPCKKVGVAQQQEKPLKYTFTKKPLFGFVGDDSQHNNENNIPGIPFSLLDYIELVDWSGRIIREDKRGAISNQRPRLLSMLGLDDDTWLSLASSFGKDYHGAVGSLEALATYASNTGKRWIASKNQLRLH